MSAPGLGDDKTIRDECELFRRVLVTPGVHIIWDNNLGRWRPTSAAFRDHQNGSPMSVCLGDILVELGRPPESVLQGNEGLALAVITAGLARQNNQGVVRDPLPDEPAHGHVVGKKKKEARVMAKTAAWVVDPGLPPPNN